jgi:hypothetical protein
MRSDLGDGVVAPDGEAGGAMLGDGEGSLCHKPYIEILRGNRDGWVENFRRGMSRRIGWVTG